METAKGTIDSSKNGYPDSIRLGRVIYDYLSIYNILLVYFCVTSPLVLLYDHTTRSRVVF